MLVALSIRNIVLIDRLDLDLNGGLTALTGETGAGKSIMLDALGLALGGRGDGALVRSGAEQGSVTAVFALGDDHAVRDTLRESEVACDGDLILRRVQSRDGRARAFVNDQPVSVQFLKSLGSLLVEIHGQHDNRALLETQSHRRLLDAFGGLAAQAGKVAAAWAGWQDAAAALAAHREAIAAARRDREYLEHAVEELEILAPTVGEEEELAGLRQVMMHAEKFASDLGEAQDALSGDSAPEARLAAALRKLERSAEQAAGRLDGAVKAIDAALVEMAEARAAIAAAVASIEFDPRQLERAEERLFALRAMARKHNVQVDRLPALLAEMNERLASLGEGESRLTDLEGQVGAARERYLAAAAALGDERRRAATALDKAVRGELAPLKLEKARFETRVEDLGEEGAGPHGMERVEFTVAANPGTPLASLAKVASGGELARFMLALKVVLAARGSAPTLIFDEIDTGVGGAVAEAIGVRLARLADGLQVFTVTHSPQVAARADMHLRISKGDDRRSGDGSVVTRVDPLDSSTRREEIARMLAGATVTDEARAAADRLIGHGA